MANLRIEEIDNSVVFKVKVVPGSRQTCVCGLLDDMVKIKVSAAPEKGKANKCLLDLLSKKLDVKRNGISIISGKTSAVKDIQVMGISAKQLSNKLNLNKCSVGQ